ncbi:MAG: heparinase II/III-family protein [Puniceicoccales bacterium]|nr:heparinase II/III-family protein [Puniceicoccales bacterium]
MFFSEFKYFLSILLAFSALASAACGQDAQNLLSGKYSAAELQQLLIPRDKWTPFPRLNDRNAWAQANQQDLQTYLAYAEKHRDYEWPTLTATLSMIIARTGSRTEYQRVSYAKRSMLATFILAEIAENKGRFIDPIVNGIWSICEESWWGTTAHLPDQYKGLMDVSRPRVDLYAGVTAGVLAWADYFLGEKLDAVSPQIRKRIYHEVNTRILSPLMTYPHWWMTTSADGSPPNNWNTWICSNWLTCALLLEKDGKRRAEIVAKILQTLDNFVNPYPADGGCDEGPGYWGASFGALYNNLVLLNLATNDSFRYVFEDEKIKNMGRFTHRVQISEDYTLNFADAGPRHHPDAKLVFRIGRDIGDPALARFAAHYYKPGTVSPEGVRGHFAGDFFNLFLNAEIERVTPALTYPQHVWLPNLQVAAFRERADSTDGFYVGAKGGTNNESHNHNDIGNFVVYYDGLPVLIDVGSGKYTAKTFTEERYNIWNLRSDYHNTPSINDVPQSAGSEFRAAKAAFEQRAHHVAGKKPFPVFSLDISAAYPPQAGVKFWSREISLLAEDKRVEIQEKYSLTNKSGNKVTEHFMTCHPVELSAPGRLTLHSKDKDGNPVDFFLLFPAEIFRASVEKIPLTTENDTGVFANWGDSIYRIKLETASGIPSSGSFHFRVEGGKQR